MNILIFSGRATDSPQIETRGDTKYTRLRLIRNEYIGSDGAGGRKEREVSIQFTAFAKMAEALARNVKTGDQLIIHASVSNNNYTKDNVKIFGFNFEVIQFEFGAPGAVKRKILAERQQH